MNFLSREAAPRVRPGRWQVLWLAGVWLGLTSSIEPVLSPVSAAEGARLDGTVHYDADPARPWRYARYYVSRTPDRALSDALVCLRGRSLKQTAPAEPRVAQMDQIEFRFIPEVLAIRAGDQVRFTNSDAALHNVQDLGGAEPLNVSLPQEGEYLYTFRRAGNSRKPTRLGCSFHSQMQAWIYVFDHPFFAVTTTNGAFTFENVPPGEYDLDVMHPSGKLSLSRSVKVVAGQAQTLPVRLTPDHLQK